MPVDVSSLASLDRARSKHLHFTWEVDFASQSIRGSVLHQMQVTSATPISELVFDTRALVVSGVFVETNHEEREAGFHLGDESVLGTPLTVTLPKELSPGTEFRVRIVYSTTAGGTALCWIAKEQTDDKSAPYLYSQCQAIHARSLFPCQDSPDVRTTYSADVTAPDGVVVLMSALSTESVTSPTSGKTFRFSQPIPIASYLVAIAVGDLASQDISHRCRIWTEPSQIARVAYEFAELEQFLLAAESIAGPYEWQRYDLLVLPSCFPFGGMENPNLTFVTPSVVAGDRSLVEVVVHEICHSWSGNLVGIRNWQEFFLNEGFTTMLQRKITAKLHGASAGDFEALICYDNLVEDVKRYGATNPLTCLRPNLSGIDPDDAFSSIPYEKGYLLLRYLESLVGTPAFDAWLRSYFATFRLASIDACDMQRHFLASFPNVEVDWDAWWHVPGLPKQGRELFDDSLARECKLVAEEWSRGTYTPLPSHWRNVPHLVYFIQSLTSLEESVNDAVVEHLDNAKGFSDGLVNNSEVLRSWFMLCSQPFRKYRRHVPHLKRFVIGTGRMKFVRPGYRALFALDPEDARRLFTENKTCYHAIAQAMLAKDLGLA